MKERPLKKKEFLKDTQKRRRLKIRLQWLKWTTINGEVYLSKTFLLLLIRRKNQKKERNNKMMIGIDYHTEI